MKNFVVIFLLKPAVRIDKKFSSMDFTFKEHDGTKRVVVHRIEEMVAGQMVQTGLMFRVYLDGNDVRDARHQAKVFVDGVVGFIAFATGMGMKIPTEVLSYEISPEAKEKEFLQIFWNITSPRLSRRTISSEFLVRVIDGALKKAGSSYHCIPRALGWYRMGISTSDIFDKFNCFWIGLESLNSLLSQRLNISHDDKITKCEKCGHTWTIPDKTIAGIRFLIKDEMKSPTLYKDLRKLRVNLMHSTCQLAKLGSDARRLTPKLAETLFRAVCLLLDFPDWSTLEYKATLEEVPLRLEVEGKVLGDFDSNFGFDGNDPLLIGQFNLTELHVKDDGSYAFTIKSNFTQRAHPSQNISPSSVTIFGDKEMEGSSIDINIIKKPES